MIQLQNMHAPVAAYYTKSYKDAERWARQVIELKMPESVGNGLALSLMVDRTHWWSEGHNAWLLDVNVEDFVTDLQKVVEQIGTDLTMAS